MIQIHPAQGLQIRIKLSIAMPQSEGTYASCDADSARTPSGFDCLRTFRDGSNAIRSMVTDLSPLHFSRGSQVIVNMKL